MTTITNRLLYDRKSAATMLSVSVRTLDYYLANGKFQTRRVGRKVLIPHGELVRFARADHFGPVAEQPDAVRQRNTATISAQNSQEAA